jgi:hypothetical protein
VVIAIKRIIVRSLSIFILCLIISGGVFSFTTTPTYASESIANIPEFDQLQGDGQYLKSDYRDNYYLDIEETGLLESGDQILNNISNALFSVISTLGYLVTAFFYFAMDFDIAALFSQQIDGMQVALKSSIFDTFFILAFSGTAWALFKKLSKRDMAGLLVDIGKIFVIVLLSALVVTHSSKVLSGTTSITKDISVSALMDINGQGNVDVSSYAANASGILWKSLVYDPWMSLEFGSTSPTEGEIKKFLTIVPGTDERKDLIKTYIEDHKNEDESIFSKSLGIKRIGFLIVYLIPFLIKSAIYLFMAVLQLAFQVMAVFYVLLAPVILLLALLPAFGDIDLIATWLKKILETQLMILTVTFLIGIIIKLDNLLYAMSGTYGWLIVILMETLIALIVVLNYKNILKGMGKVSAGTQIPRILKHRLQRSGNVFEALGTGSQNISSKRRRPATTNIRNRNEETVADNEIESEKSRTHVAVEQPSASKAPVKRKTGFIADNEAAKEDKTIPRPTTTGNPTQPKEKVADKESRAIKRPITTVAPTTPIESKEQNTSRVDRPKTDTEQRRNPSKSTIAPTAATAPQNMKAQEQNTSKVDRPMTDNEQRRNPSKSTTLPAATTVTPQTMKSKEQNKSKIDRPITYAPTKKQEKDPADV